MKRIFHLSLLALAAALASLVAVGSAVASLTPTLVASSAAQRATVGLGATRIGFAVGEGDDAVARITVFVPAGYRVAAASPGRLGDVTATAAPLQGPVLALTGQLSAVAPTPETNAGAARCQISPLQTWNLALTAPGLLLNIPVFVAASPLAGYTAVLVLCPASPQSAALGAKVLSAT